MLNCDKCLCLALLGRLGVVVHYQSIIVNDVMVMYCKEWYMKNLPSLMPTPHVPPGEKRSGERSQISWAYSPKRWKTNEIARLLIIT